MNRTPRRPRRLALVGTALTAGALLITAPADADTTRPDATTRPLVVVIDTPWEELAPMDRTARSNGIWVSNVGRADLTDVTVTVDASALKAVSDDVDVPCDPDGDLIGVCHGIGPVRRGVPVRVGAVRVGLPKTSAVGLSRQVRISASAGDGSHGMQRYTTLVREIGQAFDRAANARERLAPGGTLPLPGGFTNFTRTALPAVEVLLTLSPGLSLTERFRNCVWVREETRLTTVSCKVRGPFAPLSSYDLDLGAVRAGADALRESIGYEVRSWSSDKNRSLPLGDEQKGDGPDELTAVPRSSAATHLRADAEAQRPLRTAVDVASTADFAVTGATLRGGPGDVVRAEFTVRNLGPGSREGTQKEELSNYGPLWLSVPPGVTVVHAPRNCFGHKTSRPPKGYPPGEPGLGGPKGRGYGCGGTLGQYLAAGKELRYAFEFRLEASGDLRPGSVTTMYQEDDPHPKNNTARVEVEER
ncbi:hypothetical protein [Streptomyces triticiradicis]|uniref:DUF11 domain-containing protein n=1 Tax=Streptomyces triticiradicis TaxID=2651189 RepID=A0A7J5DN33_9ACTN|nr:hypothetical protein [Streptomyces triticiradicis]KAB1990084.1 hypothetical protein F8144_03170 [Streptomyces triticiradicis]